MRTETIRQSQFENRSSAIQNAGAGEDLASTGRFFYLTALAE